MSKFNYRNGVLYAEDIPAKSLAEKYGTPLYVYSAKATMRQAENRLMQSLREREPELRAAEVFLRGGYRSEYDAMSLLHKLGNLYEPLRLFSGRRKG